METKKHITAAEAKSTGEQLGIHIALAHLNEFPDYYTRLLKMEKEAEAQASHV